MKIRVEMRINFDHLLHVIVDGKFFEGRATRKAILKNLKYQLRSFGEDGMNEYPWDHHLEDDERDAAIAVLRRFFPEYYSDFREGVYRQ